MVRKVEVLVTVFLGQANRVHAAGDFFAPMIDDGAIGFTNQDRMLAVGADVNLAVAAFSNAAMRVADRQTFGHFQPAGIPSVLLNLITDAQTQIRLGIRSVATCEKEADRKCSGSGLEQGELGFHRGCGPTITQCQRRRDA